MLALAAARNNDRVGVAFATDRIEHYVAPAKGRRQALRVISELLSYQPGSPETDLARALTELEPVLRRRAVIFLLSDFLAAGYDSRARPAGAAPRRDRGPGGRSPRARAAGRGTGDAVGSRIRRWRIVNTGDGECASGSGTAPRAGTAS